MLVHFSASTPGYVENIELYRQISNTITSTGHELTREFTIDIPTQIEMAAQNMLDNEDWETLCSRELRNLQMSDAVILDATDKATFGVGYQAAVALTQQKPLLLLLRENSLQGSFISGLKHPLLSRITFNDDNIAEGIKGFLERAARA